MGRGVEPTELGPAIDDLSADLDPLISDLNDTSLNLNQLASNVDVMAQDLPEMAEHVRILQGDLADGADSMEALRSGLAATPTDRPDTGPIKLLILLTTATAVGVELLLGAVLAQLRSLKVVDRAESQDHG